MAARSGAATWRPTVGAISKAKSENATYGGAPLLGVLQRLETGVFDEHGDGAERGAFGQAEVAATEIDHRSRRRAAYFGGNEGGFRKVPTRNDDRHLRMETAQGDGGAPADNTRAANEKNGRN